MPGRHPCSARHTDGKLRTNSGIEFGRAPPGASELADDGPRNRPVPPTNRNGSQKGHDISAPSLQSYRSDPTVEELWENIKTGFVSRSSRLLLITSTILSDASPFQPVVFIGRLR